MMHGTGPGVRDVRHPDVAADGFFNTKTLAMNGHGILPAFQLLHLLDRCDLTWRSREETAATHIDGCRKPAVNHEPCAFIENKRYPANPQPLGDVVNRNGAFVYQTKRVFVVYSPRAQRRRLVSREAQCKTKPVSSTSCPETSASRCLPALLSSALVLTAPRRSTGRHPN